MDIGTEIKVFRYRWIILFLFFATTVLNCIQVSQFPILTRLMAKFYNVSDIVFHGIGLIFLFVYAVLFLPVCFTIEKYNLRRATITSTFLTFIGITLKVFCAEPDRIYIVIIGQILCASGQVFILSIPSKLAMTWFGPNEVSTACAMALFGFPFGTAMGSLIPPLVVNEANDETISESLRWMLIIESSIACIILVLVFIFFRARPRLPPSQSQLMLLQQNEVPKFLNDYKKVLQLKESLKVLLVFGIFIGIFFSFSVLLNSAYTEIFPSGQTELGIIATVAILAGCTGNVVCGLILDKTHKFRFTSCLLMLSSTVALSVLIYMMYIRNNLVIYFILPIHGFLCSSALVVGVEYILETTYPIPESVSCSILTASYSVCAIIICIGSEFIVNSIGYLYTFLTYCGITLCCGLAVFTFSSKLRRYEANNRVSENPQ